MPAEYVTSILEGQDFYVTDIDPNGVVTAKRGSLAIRQDDGNVTVYVNTTVGVTGVGSTWVVLMQTGWAGISQILLRDNASPALDIGSTGLTNLLRFVTTNGAERLILNAAAASVLVSGGNGLEFNSGSAQIRATGATSLLDVGSNATSVASSTSGVAALVYRTFSVPANSSGGGVDTAFVLPNQRSLRLVDARIVSGGAGGGGQSVQVLNNALASITDAMQPGAANAVTRMASYNVANALFTAGQTLYARTTNTTVATTLTVVFAVE